MFILSLYNQHDDCGDNIDLQRDISAKSTEIRIVSQITGRRALHGLYSEEPFSLVLMITVP